MRPTLALLLDNLFDSYQEQFWRAVCDAAAARDANLLVFVGGAFAPPGGNELGGKNLVYGLLPGSAVDGLLTVSGALGYHLGDAEFVARLEALTPVPKVCVGRPVPGLPTLVLDNRRASRELVSHLIERHGCRRIGFVRGPAGSEADPRLQGYRDALEEAGLPFDPDLVVPGDFSRASGIEAVRTLLDVRRVAFDALMGANDYMALYALQELKARGVRVPEDVRVVGFDDIADAAGATPSLTTVAQPMREMGAAAVDLLLLRLAGERLPEQLSMGGRVVLRRSCGCSVHAAAPPEEPDERGGPLTVAGALELAHPWLARHDGPEARSARLARALLGALDPGPAARRAFLAVLEELMARDLAQRRSAAPWFAALRAGFETLRRAAPEPVRGRVDALWVDALSVAAQAAEEAQAAARTRAEEEFKSVQRVFFPTDITEEEVRRILVSQLPNLGVRSFYLSRYTAPDRARAQLIAHFGPPERVALDAAPGPFPSARLVPGRFSPEHRHAFAVLPVYSRDDHLGFALVELAALSGGAYEGLMNQISTAVRVSALLAAVRSHSEELERKVAERTRELAGAQRQLLDAARQAGMAEIAVGALHNIGNLLNSVNVSAGELATRGAHAEVAGLRRAAALLETQRPDLARFFREDARAALLPEYLGRLADRLAAEQERIRAEAQGMQSQAALIRDTILALQSYAREGEDLLPREAVDLAELVDTALRVQAASVARHAVRVEQALADLPEVISQRSKLLHVLVNVVKNAVDAMRAVPEARRRLAIQGRAEEDGGVVLVFTDQGEGISAEHLPRVFSYGFTTKPDGNGFGLHASANIMQQLGGEIRVESAGVQRGARVTLRFPPG